MVLGATTAEIALVVAIVSAALSLGSLVWQLVLYHLSGARLVVELVPAVLTETGHIMRGPAKGWRRIPEDLNVVHNRPWVDAAVIKIVNAGRAPVSVSDITLDVGADPRWQPWRRHTVGMPPIPVHGGLADITDVRLEAAQSVTVIVDYWPVVDAARKQRKRVRLRASVLPAGRRARRSPRRERWKIRRDQRHLWPHGPEGDEVELFQAVWRAVAPIKADAVYSTWLSVLNLLSDPDMNPKELRVGHVGNAIKSTLGESALRPTIAILGALHRYGRPGAWMIDPPRSEPGEEPATRTSEDDRGPNP